MALYLLSIKFGLECPSLKLICVLVSCTVTDVFESTSDEYCDVGLSCKTHDHASFNSIIAHCRPETTGVLGNLLVPELKLDTIFQVRSSSESDHEDQR